MPFDGSGNFNRVMNWVSDAAATIKILATRHDAEDDNFASGLSNTLTKDGQSQPTANIPMNGKKLVNLGAPTTGTDAVTKTYADLKAPIASPTFTGKVTLPTGSAALAPLAFPTAVAPTTPAHGDIWPDSTNGALKQFIVSTTFTYGRLETSQTWTARQFFAANGTGNSAMANASFALGEVGISGNGTGAAMALFNRISFIAYLGIDTDNFWKVGGGSMGANAYKILHEGLASASFTGAYSWAGAQNFGALSTTGATAGVRIVPGQVAISNTGTSLSVIGPFYNANGLVGSISTNASATAYSTSSDQRLKENFRDFDANAILDATAVYLFDWKAGGTGYGVVAQEAQLVFPDAVVAGLGEPGDEIFMPMSVDYSKFVPVLIKGMKSMRARMTTLEARVAALEGTP